MTDGTVRLYHDNAEKIKTTATGIDVTGVAVVDGLTSSAIATVDELSVTNDATFNGSIDVGGGTIDCGAITSTGVLTINEELSGDTSKLVINNTQGATLRMGITGSGANEAAHIKTNFDEALEFHIGQASNSSTP